MRRSFDGLSVMVSRVFEDLTVCPNGNPRAVIGEDVSEQIDHTPA